MQYVIGCVINFVTIDLYLQSVNIKANEVIRQNAKSAYTLSSVALLRRVLRKLFGPKRDEVKEVGENCIMRSCMSCTLRPVLLR
jgi:predicted solute-binding protein